MCEFAPLEARHDIDRQTFETEVMPADSPVIFRGFAADWPVVRAARESRAALARLIKGLDGGRQPHVIEAPAEVQGRIFYRDDMSGFNFTRLPASISDTVDKLLQL